MRPGMLLVAALGAAVAAWLQRRERRASRPRPLHDWELDPGLEGRPRKDRENREPQDMS